MIIQRIPFLVAAIGMMIAGGVCHAQDANPVLPNPVPIDPQQVNPQPLEPPNAAGNSAEPEATDVGDFTGDPAFVQPSGEARPAPVYQQGEDDFKLLEPYAGGQNKTSPIPTPHYTTPPGGGSLRPQYRQQAGREKNEMTLKIFQLKNAEASACHDVLSELFGGQVTIAVDERINAVVVRATESDLKTIEALLLAIDTPTQKPDAEVIELRGMSPLMAEPGADLGAGLPSVSKREAAEAEARANELARRFRFPRQRPATNKQLDDMRRQLRSAVAEAFDARLKMQQTQIELLRQKLSKIEQQVHARASLRDRIIDRRTEELLDPNLEWETGPELGEAPRATASVPAGVVPPTPSRFSFPKPPVGSFGGRERESGGVLGSVDSPSLGVAAYPAADPPSTVSQAQFSILAFEANPGLISTLGIEVGEHCANHGERRDIKKVVDQYVENDQATILAEPVLVTTLGRSASFGLRKGGTQIRIAYTGVANNQIFAIVTLSEPGPLSKETSISLALKDSPVVVGPISFGGKAATYVAISGEPTDQSLPATVDPLARLPLNLGTVSARPVDGLINIPVPSSFIKTVREIERDIKVGGTWKDEAGRRRLKATHDRLKAQLNATRSEYQTMIELLKLRVETAQAEAEHARRNHQRMRTLMDDAPGSVSQTEEAKAREGYFAKRATVEQLEKTLELYIESEAAIFGDNPDGIPPRNDASSLEGRWRVRVNTANGATQTHPNTHLVIENDLIQVVRDGAIRESATIRVDADKKQIDLVNDPSNPDSTRLYGIYRQDATRLYIVFSEKESDRPQDFENTNRKGIDYWELEIMPDDATLGGGVLGSTVRQPAANQPVPEPDAAADDSTAAPVEN